MRTRHTSSWTNVLHVQPKKPGVTMEMPGNSDATINVGCRNSRSTAPTLHSPTQCLQRNTAGKHGRRKENGKPTIGSSYSKKKKEKKFCNIGFFHAASASHYTSHASFFFYPTAVLMPGLSVLKQDLSFHFFFFYKHLITSEWNLYESWTGDKKMMDLLLSTIICLLF